MEYEYMHERPQVQRSSKADANAKTVAYLKNISSTATLVRWVIIWQIIIAVSAFIIMGLAGT